LLRFNEQVLQEREKMKKLLAIASIFIFGILLIIMLDACTVFQRRVGTGRGEGAFDSNGERIYITATSERYARITYSGGPPSGMMMGGGNLACASCHAPDAQGELHTMMGMQIMDAPDIRWVSIAGEVDEGHGEEEEGHGGEEEGHGEGGMILRFSGWLLWKVNTRMGNRSVKICLVGISTMRISKIWLNILCH
jgi:hypothetical protein